MKNILTLGMSVVTSYGLINVDIKPLGYYQPLEPSYYWSDEEETEDADIDVTQSVEYSDDVIKKYQSIISRDDYRYGRVSQHYGHTDFAKNRSKWYRFHNGLDIVFVNKNIPALASGRVLFAGWNKQGFGNAVIIKTGNAEEMLYGHLSSINVKIGDIVRAGEVIGVEGSTGNSTASHLHFGVKQYGKYVDPMDYIQSLGQSSGIVRKIPELMTILNKYRDNTTAIRIRDYFEPRYGQDIADRFILLAYWESGFNQNTEANNIVENSYSIFQINAREKGGHANRIKKYTNSTDLNVNKRWLQENIENSFKIAEEIWKEQGFRPWTKGRKWAKSKITGDKNIGNKIINL